ncbi:MAG: hypothetical protein HY717_06480 [Planctomycetes bacterium]|nr:hypothetical protein [Planctomycetota bacterium]
MDRVGRIIDWQLGVATVEVGLHQECVSGSCSDCHASAAGKIAIQVPWQRPYVIGQRVLVRENRGAFRSLQWLAFLLAFGAVLAAAQALFPQVKTAAMAAAGAGLGAGESAGGEAASPAALRATILAGLALGFLSGYGVKSWARRQPQHKVEALDSAAKFLAASGSALRTRGTPLSGRKQAAGFVGLDEIERVDER